jgi:signal transduction histidine kinase/CheY-like chemotaxis protein
MIETSAAPINILLVDDRPENLLALKAILRNPEYRIVTANSGVEALAVVLREEFAVILLDVAMPGMDGLEVATHLKELERTRDIPIIFVTAVATDVNHIYRAYEIGAVDYLIKPLDPETVRKKVGVFITLVQQREQIKNQAKRLREAERREYEDRLARLRLAGDRRYQKLVEGIDHVIGWSAIADPFRLSFISRRAEDIMGYPVSSFAEGDAFLRRIHPDDLKMVLDMFQEAIHAHSDRACEHRMFAADGRVLWFHTGVSASPAAETNALELHGVSVDMTPIKTVEQNQRFLAEGIGSLAAILEHEARLAQLARMVVPYLADWCLIDEVTGPHEVRHIAMAHRNPDREDLLRQLQRGTSFHSRARAGIGHVLQTDRPEIHRRIDDAHWLAEAIGAQSTEAVEVLGASSCMILPLSARGRILGIMTLVSSGQRRFTDADLTLADELRHRAALAIDNARLYEEAKNAIAARDQLLAIVSHDLRTPLSTISAAAGMCEQAEDPAKREQQSALILRSAKRMDRLIGDLLDLAKIEAGRLTIERHAVDAQDLVREISETFATLAEGRSQRLESESEPVAVYCDYGRTLQILSNLVGNAVKFTPEGGTIELRIDRGEHEAVFSVSDSGPGISAEELPHVFERFYQTGKTSRVGVGLGLAIVKALVEAQEGRVWVESEVGVGTTFFFTLPRSDVAATKESERREGEGRRS